MAEADFYDIDSTQFTDIEPTGEEKIQISATKKTSLQKIANLFKALSAKLTGFTPLTNIPVVGDIPISSEDTLLKAIQKLSYGLLNDGKIIIVSRGSELGIILWDQSSSTGSYIYISEGTFIYSKDSVYSGILEGKTTDEILYWMVAEYNPQNIIIQLDRLQYDNLVVPINLTRTISSASFNLQTATVTRYTGTNTSPNITLVKNNFKTTAPTATLIVPYNVKPNFIAGSGTVLHKQVNFDEVSPESGFKVYTVLAHTYSSQTHLFINVASYN